MGESYFVLCRKSLFCMSHARVLLVDGTETIVVQSDISTLVTTCDGIWLSVCLGNALRLEVIMITCL